MLVVYGYAAWGARQLDGEVRAGSWTLHGASGALVLDAARGRRAAASFTTPPLSVLHDRRRVATLPYNVMGTRAV